MDGIEQSASLLVIRQTHNCNAEDIQMLTTLEDVAFYGEHSRSLIAKVGLGTDLAHRFCTID
jgi:hypothetical protein